MIEKLIDTILKTHITEPENAHLSFEAYIRDLRTISLGLPRRSGKTTFCNAHAKNTSSYHFVKLPGHKNFDVLTEFRKFYGTKSEGLKLDCIILEEYTAFPEGFIDFVTELKARGMLKPNFYVLMIGTPR